MEIAKYSQIDKNKLDYNKFTISLIDIACNASLLKLSEVEDIQFKIMTILSELIKEYTDGESSSVTTETAENIMDSILYCMDTHLLSFLDVEESLQVLQSHKIKDIYSNGLKQVKVCLNECMDLLKIVQDKKVLTVNVAYNLTIDKSIPSFLKNYDARFYANNPNTIMEYILSVEDRNRTGLFYIQNYIKILILENEFCSYLPISNIDTLLDLYSKIYNLSCRDMFVNIFEVVLYNLVYLAFLNKTHKEFVMSKTEYEYLKNIILTSSKPEISKKIFYATEYIIKDLDIQNQYLKNYIRKSLEKLSKMLSKAFEIQNIKSLEIVYKRNKNNLSYVDGNKISDADFREFIAKLSILKDTTEKISVISQKIHNLNDIIDIFSSGYIFENEYLELFSIFGDMEISIVLKKIEHHISIDRNKFLIDDFGLSYNESQWQNKFIEYLNTLENKRIDAIKNIFDSLKL